MGISFFANIGTLIFTGSCNYVIFYFPLMYLLQFFLYRGSVSNVLKRNDEAYEGKPVEVKLLVTEECITNIAANGATYKANYSDIKKVSITKNLLLIFTKAKLMYVVSKSGFTKGTSDELISFLQNKGILVSIF